jgi:hypothetical protein
VLEGAFRRLGPTSPEVYAATPFRHGGENAVTSPSANPEVYQKLIAVVREASRVNLAQAALQRHIVDPGSTVVVIARRGTEARSDPSLRLDNVDSGGKSFVVALGEKETAGAVAPAVAPPGLEPQAAGGQPGLS